MIESDFYSRLFLILLFGACFVFVMVKSARKNPDEERRRKQVVTKVLGVFCFLLSLLLCYSLVRDFEYLDFPHESLSQPITPHTVLRDSSHIMFWGYPTTIQNKIFMDTLGVLELIAFGLYFVLFKPSKSPTWVKICKVVICILLFFFMSAATDLHYFDSFELFAPIITIALMVLFAKIGRPKPKSRVVEMASVRLSSPKEETNEVVLSEEDVKL